MASDKPDILLIGPAKPVFVQGLEPTFTVHRLNEATDRDAFIAAIADRVRAFAVTYSNQKVSGELMARFPRLELVATFGVGYDHVDAKWAGAHGIIVTHTPDVLT
jgi:lactate dehydrogenase-like 2-hydroxyacid dehydrogenase